MISPKYSLSRRLTARHARTPHEKGTASPPSVPLGISGMFGRELPGEWLAGVAARKERKRIVAGHRFAGHSRSRVAWFEKRPSERLSRALDRFCWHGLGRYDTHAARTVDVGPLRRDRWKLREIEVDRTRIVDRAAFLRRLTGAGKDVSANDRDEWTLFHSHRADSLES